MWLKYCWCLNCVVLTTQAIKISISGAVNAGPDVGGMLARYFDKKPGRSMSMSGRRSMTSTFDELANNVKQIEICKDLPFCKHKMQGFLVDYMVGLLNIMSAVFKGVLDDEHCKVKYAQKTLKQARKFIKKADEMNDDEVYRWTHVIKGIGAIYLEKSLELAEEASNKTDRNKQEAMITIRQQLVYGIMNYEKEYQTKLCKEFSLCPYQYDASTYLQHLLNLIKTMNETKVKVFLKGFKKVFLEAPMLKELDERTMVRFNQIINDMMMQETVSAKNIILSITEVVQKRLAQMEPKGKDGFLLQAILSDLDHLYVNSVDDPIETFLDSFKRWIKDDDAQAFSSSMESFYNGLGVHFANQSAELVNKLKAETLVFLELTMQ